MVVAMKAYVQAVLVAGFRKVAPSLLRFELIINTKYFIGTFFSSLKVVKLFQELNCFFAISS